MSLSQGILRGRRLVELLGRPVLTLPRRASHPLDVHSPPPQEMQVEELGAVRQALQADLETSIRRIVDLQAALEEVESSDESDSER